MGGGGEKSKLDQISSWAVDMQSVRLKKFWMPIQKIFPSTFTALIRHKTNVRKLKVVIINKALILFQP